jgi:hypothetical protein
VKNYNPEVGSLEKPDFLDQKMSVDHDIRNSYFSTKLKTMDMNEQISKFIDHKTMLNVVKNRDKSPLRAQTSKNRNAEMAK